VKKQIATIMLGAVVVLGHSYRFTRETDKQRGLRLRRLSCRLLCIADIALIVVKTAKPPDHCDLTALRLAQIQVRNSSTHPNRY
jgi:hypothetical protein